MLDDSGDGNLPEILFSSVCLSTCAESLKQKERHWGPVGQPSRYRFLSVGMKHHDQSNLKREGLQFQGLESMI